MGVRVLGEEYCASEMLSSNDAFNLDPVV